MLVTKQLLIATDIHSYISMATGNFLFTSFLQNIFFCVQQEKVVHTGFKQHEGE